MSVFRTRNIWIQGVVDSRPPGVLRHRYLLGIVVGLQCVVCGGRSIAQVGVEPTSPSESKSTKTSAQEDEQVATFQPPIAIVDAVEFQVGGTTYVQLKDSQGKLLRFCVSENGFAETIPGNTLFLDASHPDDLDARLPVSEEEVAVVIGSLRKALHSAIPEANRVGDPKILAVATCRALGILRDSWNSSTTRDQIAIQAMLTVSADDFANALPELADDQSGLLGAGRFFFYFDCGSKFNASAWEEWALPITRALLDHGVDDNKSMVVLWLSFSRHAKAGDIVRRIARGEFGVEPDPKEQWGDEPGIKATAYLGLATRGDNSVREDIEQALSGESTKPDRAAMELALATLGSPEYLRKEHFELDSHIIGMGALRAIERFDGHHGMDMSMAAGLEHNYAAISNEAIVAAQRITGQKWIPEGSRFQPRKYADDAQAWWVENGQAFKAERSK
ncbi:hypothetical protein OAS39_08185 [Pirellulales bacterium]|nr:hypothetical protein [Pirellulales bacterium]